MSRLDEVEASIRWIMSAGLTGGAITPNMRDLARTLAAEVDELRGKLDALRAELARVKAESLRVVKLAAMYETYSNFSCGYFRHEVDIWYKPLHDQNWAHEINHNEHRAFVDSEPVEWIRLERWEDE